MRIVVAPQEFKGSLTAAQAADAIADGLRSALPAAEIDVAPMSDGGAGLVDAMLAALGGERVQTDAHDPLMRPVRATWARLGDGTAAIEMAAASGLVLVSPEQRDPRITTTFGTGELLLDALDRRAQRIVVGVGGSATVDAGAGAMQALGARLLDAGGHDLPPGGAALARLERIDLSNRDPRLAGADVIVASDVTNPLCGPEGAASVYGPQKGATSDDVAVLDRALERFAEVVRRDCGVDLSVIEGAGAAGGLGCGLMLVAGASIVRGFKLVADAARLDARIAVADAVITGEGRLDAQTPYGKTAAGVAALAHRHGKPVVCLAGSVDAAFDRPDLFDQVESVAPGRMTTDEAMRRGAELLRAAALRVAVKLDYSVRR